MFQISLSRSWLIVLASCVLSFVMLISVMPPPASSLRAGSSQYAGALPGTKSTLAAGVKLSTSLNAQSGDPGAAVSYTVWLTNTSTTNTDSYTINLYGSWDDDAPPQVNSVLPGQSVPFTVIVTVAQNVFGGDKNVTTVVATSHKSPIEHDLLELTTTASNVYGVALTPPASTKLGDPSATLSYALTVMNTGNATDSYIVTNSSSNSAYRILAPTGIGPLAGNEAAPLIVSVTVPSGALAGTANVAAITVTSNADDTKFGSALVTTTVNAVYSLTLVAPIHAQTAGPGTAAKYVAHVTNPGNIEDIVTLAVVGNWTATINGSNTSDVTLPPFGSTDVNVIVNIPPNAPENSSDVTTLTATSHGKPTLTASTTFTTTGQTFNWPPLWAQGAGDITSKTVYQIAVCPADSQRLYAGTITTGVYASTNAGLSWSQTGLGGVLVRGVAVNPVNCDEAYAFAWGPGVVKTINGGATWTPVNSGLGELYGYSVVISPSQPQTVYIGTNASGVYSSADGGAHWSHTAIPNTTVLGLSIGPDGAVYAATFGTGVYRLKDGIAQALNGGALSATANVFAVAASPSALFAATETGLYRSANGGTVWTLVLSGTGRAFSVLIDPQDAQIVYVGVEFSGVWRSVDGGLMFNSYSQGMPSTGIGVRNVAIGSATSSYLHAGTVLNGAWHLLTVTGRIYLPLVLRGWPPVPGAPTLNAISNPTGLGSYTVRWTPTGPLATSYILQAAQRSDFTDAVQVYAGPAASFAVNAQGPTRYYYRVKGRNSWGDSGWSNAQFADVLWEKEPNDDVLTQANGAIISGLTYSGALSSAADLQDYFYFDLPAGRTIELWLTNIPAGSDYDLYLRDAALAIVGQSDRDGNEDEYTSTSVLPPGRYYIQIYNRNLTGSAQAYHLRANYR